MGPWNDNTKKPKPQYSAWGLKNLHICLKMQLGGPEMLDDEASGVAAPEASGVAASC